MPSASDAAVAALTRDLARVQTRHAERTAQPALAEALAHLAAWQVRRLRRTYADLEATPRYAAAMQFFESDLYGGADFAQRDADLVRIVPAMKRLLPAGVLETIASAVELNALSLALDRAMIDELWPLGREFRVADYCAAYRRVGQFPRRLRQIRLIGDVGVALDRYVHKPMVHAALRMMRKPAHAAGLAALQDFLERGFAAFGRMGGAVEFLATIESRETLLHEAIAAGSNDPFPDPLGSETLGSEL